MNTDSTAYELLKRDLIDFAFRPGERLIEESLSLRYGVSRTPIRDALKRLEQEGLVVTHEGGGRFVPLFDITEFEDIYRVRAVIEPLAVAQAVERASDFALAELRSTWDEAYRRDPLAPGGSYDFADERLHTGITALSQNSFLVDSLARITNRIRIMRVVDFADSERVGITKIEHDNILDAMLARDADVAGKLMQSHIEGSMASVGYLVRRALEHVYLGG